MASKLQLTGGCLCGAIGYRLGGNFRAHYCHCGMCRRATGSAFAVLVWTDRENLQWTGPEPEQYRSSPIATRGFCRQCGTSLTLHYDGGKEVAVHAGSLDQPERTVPQYHYGSEGRLSWVDCGRGLPEHHTKERW